MSTVNNNKYWMSLEQWREDSEFQKLAEQEFLSSPLAEKDGDGYFIRDGIVIVPKDAVIHDGAVI